MVYRFIDQYKETLGLRWLLRKFNISSSSYYNYRKNRKSTYQIKKQHILDEITYIYHENNGIIGYRTMRILLARRGIYLSSPTVHKYMNKELKLYSITSNKHSEKHKYKKYNIFPNLLNHQFTVSKKNKVWCTDFTCIKLANSSKIYNCTIIDLYDRSVVASTNSRFQNSELAISTLSQALKSEHPPCGLILHSDRGSQFTSLEFTEYCTLHGIKQSLSKARCPCDNAPMERFYNTLKKELIYPNIFLNEATLAECIKDYIFVWYNKIRPHSYNNWLTPFQTRFNLH